MARAVKQSPSTALSFPVPPPRCTTATAMALPLATNRTPALRPVRLPPAAVVRLPRRRIASLDWPRRPQLSRPVAVSSTAWSQTSLPSLSRLPLYARLQWRSTSTVCEFFHLVCNYLRWHCIWRHARQWCVCVQAIAAAVDVSFYSEFGFSVFPLTVILLKHRVGDWLTNRVQFFFDTSCSHCQAEWYFCLIERPVTLLQPELSVPTFTLFIVLHSLLLLILHYFPFACSY